MSNHLTDKDLNEYIHRTLTDVQRETMFHHVSRCALCHARLQEAESIQNQIGNELGMVLRYERPSANSGFGQIQAKIGRKRKAAFVRHHALRMTGTVGKFALAVLGIAFAMTMFSVTGRGEPLVQGNPAPAMYDEPWEASPVYEPVLVADEQAALESLQSAPIYHMDIAIDESLNRVFGRQQVRYVNTTSEPMTELYFALWPNLTDGRLQVSGILVDGEPTQYELVEEGLFVRVALPYRLRTLQTAVVQTEFRLDVGHEQDMFNGMLAKADNTLSLMYFHPQLVPYDEVSGWDLSMPVNGRVNVSNSYYRIRLTAPETLKVISSGSLLEEISMGGGRSSRVFSAGPISSFYLIASEEFGVHLSETVGDTTIHSYATIDYWQEDAQMALDVTVDAVRTFNEQFGTYPFAELEVVGTSTLGVNARNVEVPGVVVVKFPYGRKGGEDSVVTQISGQWFRPLVTESSQQDAWLADGLSTYGTLYYFDAVEGYTAVDDVQTKWQQGWQETEPEDPQASIPVLDDLTPDEYAEVMYNHTPLFLTWLAQRVGKMTFADFLQDYYQTYRWSGASTTQFAELLSTHCACDLSSYFVDVVPREQMEDSASNKRD